MDSSSSLRGRLVVCSLALFCLATGSTLFAFSNGKPMRPSVEAPAPQTSLVTPNILLILVDDLGMEQLECYAAEPGTSELEPGPNHYANPFPYAPTPNITRLAKDGVRFARAFASPLCSPTRGQLYTGRYAFRNQIGTIVAPGQSSVDLDPCEVLIPEVLAIAPTGESSPRFTSSALFGKWHLARAPGLASDPNAPGDAHPYICGWPVFRGILQNPDQTPFPPGGGYSLWYRVESPADPSDCPGPLSGNPPVACRTISETYLTTAQRIDVEEWTEETAEPWCAVWSTNAPHSPFDWPPGGDGRLHDYGEEGARRRDAFVRYSAMVQVLDAEIGKLRVTLEQRASTIGASESSVWDNTLVILVSDNGTEEDAVVDAGPEVMAPYIANSVQNHRFKGKPFMGGTNVPLIVRGPAEFVQPEASGSVRYDLVDIVDLWDTLRDVAGVEVSQLPQDRPYDGQTLLNTLRDGTPHTRMFSLAQRFRPNGCDAQPEFDPLVNTGCEDADFRYAIGFTMNVTTPGVEGVWRLIRTPDQNDRLFLITDANGVDQIPFESIDHFLNVDNAPYAEVAQALDALLASGGNCTECAVFTCD